MKKIPLELVFATFLIAGTALFARKLELSPEQIVFWRLLFAFLSSFLWIHFVKKAGFRFPKHPNGLERQKADQPGGNEVAKKARKEVHDFSPEAPPAAEGRSIELPHRFKVPVSLFLGVLFALHLVTYFKAIQLSDVATGIVSLFTFPVITVFLEPLFRRTRLRMDDLFAGMIIFLGVFIMVPDFSLDNSHTLGIGFGVLSACLFAVRNILTRMYFHENEPLRIMAWQTLAGCIVLLPVFLQTALPSLFQIGMLIILGTIFSSVAHSLFIGGMSKTSARRASVVTSLQPLIATVYAIVILQELPQLVTILGGSLILAAVLYESLFRHGK